MQLHSPFQGRSIYKAGWQCLEAEEASGEQQALWLLSLLEFPVGSAVTLQSPAPLSYLR